MKDKLQALLADKIKGLIYYSEYEYPVTLVDVPIHLPGDIVPFIATYKNVEEQAVKQIDVWDFFSRFDNFLKVGGNDVATLKNAGQFMDLYYFLLEHFVTIRVYRVEKDHNAEIPIIIICKTHEGTFVGLETTAVET